MWTWLLSSHRSSASLALYCWHDHQRTLCCLHVETVRYRNICYSFCVSHPFLPVQLNNEYSVSWHSSSSPLHVWSNLMSQPERFPPAPVMNPANATHSSSSFSLDPSLQIGGKNSQNAARHEHHHEQRGNVSRGPWPSPPHPPPLAQLLGHAARAVQQEERRHLTSW